MKWRDHILGLTKHARFKAPAHRDTIVGVGKSLGIEVPEELSSLLIESDGIEGEYGLGLVWSCERIVKDNLQCRTFPDFAELYMPFTSLLFFGDAGNGDQFAYAVKADGQIHDTDIFVWDHETDSRKWVAPSLEKYLDWWLTGKLTI